MTTTNETDTSNDALLTDRRRPGRPERVSPELIPLMRTSDLPASLDEDIEFEQDQISGMRGIAYGVALSAPLWVGIAYVGRWLLG